MSGDAEDRRAHGRLLHQDPGRADLPRDVVGNRLKRVGGVPALARVYATYGALIHAGVDRAQSFHAPEPILAIERWGSEQALDSEMAERIVARLTQSLAVAIRGLR